MGCVAMVVALAAARVLVDLVAAFVHANGDPWVMPLLTRRDTVWVERPMSMHDHCLQPSSRR